MQSRIILTLKANLDSLGWDAMIKLASDAGVDVTTLYGWRAGYVEQPRIDTICKVANQLGLKLTLRP